jgi:hypothetical protein
MAASCGFFMCIASALHYVGLGRPPQGGPVLVYPVRQPVQSGTHDLASCCRVIHHYTRNIMNTQLIPVAFLSDTLYLIDNDNQPFTPVKPIADALGLSWASQTVK